MRVLGRLIGRAIICSALLTAGASPALRAQLSPRRRITVIAQAAADRSPLAGVDVSVLASNQSVVAHAVTAADGRAIVIVPPGADAASVTVRKLGYGLANHTLDPFGKDETVRFSLERQVQRLETMTTQVDPRSKNYFVGASEIENTPRGLFDALIVLQKLRPQMLGDSARACGATDKVWINGRRIIFGPIPSLATGSHLSVTGPPPMTKDRMAPSTADAPLNIRDTILTTIKGEHIAEMRYINCWDDPPDGLMRDALYITLKAGVDWDWRHGSFIADQVSAAAWNRTPR